MTGWNFRGQDLRDANFSAAVLYDTDFAGALRCYRDELRGDYFSRIHARSSSTRHRSYQNRQLQRIVLAQNDMTGWDFSDQNLSRANFFRSVLIDSDLVGADLSRASLLMANVSGADLTDASLDGSLHSPECDLSRTRWSSGSQLRPGTDLQYSSFSGAALTSAALRSSYTEQRRFFWRRIVAGAEQWDTVVGMELCTRQQLYATQSYQARKFSGIVLANNDLTACESQRTRWSAGSEYLGVPF